MLDSQVSIMLPTSRANKAHEVTEQRGQPVSWCRDTGLGALALSTSETKLCGVAGMAIYA